MIRSNLIAAVKKLKATSPTDLTILGSGSLVKQLAEAGLIDVFSIMIDPVALGKGTPLFGRMTKKLDLDLVATRAFKSGTILLTYQPKSR